MTDHHCKELYRCYQCVNLDYSQNYTDINYAVDFTDGPNGRDLDCSVNAKHDSSNICECDKRFAKAISETEKSCDSDFFTSDENFGDYCLNEDWRTITGLKYGTQLFGSFDPKDCIEDHHDDGEPNE